MGLVPLAVRPVREELTYKPAIVSYLYILVCLQIDLLGESSIELALQSFRTGFFSWGISSGRFITRVVRGIPRSV